MPHAFVHLYPELADAITGSLVLTTNERLRRNLIRAYNDAQLAAGRTVWPTPRVQTLNAYLGILYQSHRAAIPGLPLLLGAEPEYQLFRATAPEGAADLSPLAQQAWNLCHQWQIPLDHRAFAESENGQTFADWCERVRRRLSNLNAITRAELPLVPGLVSPEPVLFCLAFEQLPSAQEAWLENQPGERRDLSPRAPEQRKPRAHRTSFASSQEELSAAAQWARRTLEADPYNARIGVVIPDLAHRYEAVLRQFTAVLDPRLDTGTQGVLDIGGGMPLAEQPIWQPARDWLALCFDRLPVVRARQCFLSSYLSLPDLAALPVEIPPTLNLLQLHRVTGLDELEPEIPALVRQEGDGKRRLLDWIVLFRQTLQMAGWTGQQAGSTQYQAWQEIGDRLQSFGRWADERVITSTEALRQIDQFLHSIVFAPERAPAPIQVLGYLETTGLDFTDLWVLGLDDESWPRVPTTNPFLPTRLLNEKGVPRSTPEREATFAAERMAQWRNGTDRLIVSHARQVGESERRPSPLIRDLASEVLLDLQPERPHPGFEQHHGQIESVEDLRGQPLPPGRHRGGTGRLRDQAACPFRGFAIHRLGLRETRLPHGLPDALDRGILIHEALHRLYENARTDGLMPAELSEHQFGDAADQALALHYARFPAAFRERERQRLIALLGAWNGLEIRREDVVIGDLERDVAAEFGGLGLNLRIDRIDRLGEAHIVIDYKTGRMGQRLTHERLLEPQLPLYALTDESVQGVLYAEVDENRPRLRGVAAMDIDQASLEEPVHGSWDAQRAQWQKQIDTLTEEIRTGLAVVTPYDKRACQLCHLQAVCRIGTAGEEADTGSAEET